MYCLAVKERDICTPILLETFNHSDTGLKNMFTHYCRYKDFHVYILKSTKNASLLITDFLAMMYKNEQPRTRYLCRGWAMLVNDFKLKCR